MKTVGSFIKCTRLKYIYEDVLCKHLPSDTGTNTTFPNTNIKQQLWQIEATVKVVSGHNNINKGDMAFGIAH